MKLPRKIDCDHYFPIGNDGRFNKCEFCGQEKSAVLKIEANRRRLFVKKHLKIKQKGNMVRELIPKQFPDISNNHILAIVKAIKKLHK